MQQATEAASGLKLLAIAVSPAFDVVEGDRGIISRDRELKDSGRVYFGLTE